VTRNKRHVVAVVPVEDLELLEDHVDLRAARKALQEARKQGTRPWAEVKAELGLVWRGRLGDVRGCARRAYSSLLEVAPLNPQTTPAPRSP
jgi:hypothetical protein